MKIDLHVHTKKIAKGDPLTRNITAIEFKKEIKKAEVGIVAITNHYYFDKNQYKEFKDDKYILLPGVELDILIDEKKVQANVIANPNDVNEFVEILKKIENDKNPIEYEKFVKEFDKKKWIISLDWKTDKRWDIGNIEKAIKDFKNALVIADVNKAQTLMILNANNFKALIGSDIDDWKDYNEKSKKLLNTKFEIENYDRFWSILKNEQNSIEKLFKNIIKKKIDNIVMPKSNPNGKNFSIKELTLKEGVNIIFGAKRTGKSEILKHINNKFKSNSSFYESSNKESSIKNLEENLKNEIKFSKEKKEWKEKIKEILNLKEKKFTKFSDFFYSLNNSSKIIIHNKIKTSFINPKRDNEEIIDNLKKLSKLIKESKKLLKKLNIENMIWLDESKKILKYSWNKYKEIFLKYWKLSINKEIREKIELILISNKGQKSPPTNIGLWERYNEKATFLKILKKLKNFEKKYCEKITEFKIPEREDVFARHFIFFVDFFNENEKNWNEFRNKKGRIKNIFKKIKNLNTKNFNFKINEIIDLFKKFFKNTHKDNEYFDETFIEYVKITDKNINSTFSNGEKAHLLLQKCLTENKDYYILDEPGVFLGRESITKFLLPKISNLVKERRTIVIATHNSSIGINSIPINYIHRRYKSGEDECRTYFGSIWEKNFINIKVEEDKYDFLDVIIKSFEGSKKHFKFRKEIYESNI